MKTLVSLFVFCFAFGLIMADVRYRGNAVHPDFPNQCYYEELQQPISIHQTFIPRNREGYCTTVYCRSDFVIKMELCGRHNLQPNATCQIGSDISLPYPSCCPKLVCQDQI